MCKSVLDVSPRIIYGLFAMLRIELKFASSLSLFYYCYYVIVHMLGLHVIFMEYFICVSHI